MLSSSSSQLASSLLLSNIFVIASDNIQSKINNIKSHFHQLYLIVEKLSLIKEKILITDYNDNNDNNDDNKLDIEKDMIYKIVAQIQQELLLEMSISDRLIAVDQCEDQEIITLITCFTHQPYINKDDMNAMINLKVRLL